jgi:hypothetical protein
VGPLNPRDTSVHVGRAVGKPYLERQSVTRDTSSRCRVLRRRWRWPTVTWVAAANGAVFQYGDAANDGGMTGTKLNGAIIAGTGF